MDSWKECGGVHREEVQREILTRRDPSRRKLAGGGPDSDRTTMVAVNPIPTN